MQLRTALTCLTAALMLAGCGRGLPLGAAKAPATRVKAHGTGWQQPEVLDDFNHRRGYTVYAPDMSHPFFKPLVFTFVGLRGGSNTALELLAPDKETFPRRGFVLNDDMGDDGSFLPPDADEKAKPAPHVRLSWRWNVNGAVIQDPAIWAMATFVLAKPIPGDERGRIGLAYAWTNEKYCPGQILKTVIGSGEDAIPTRVIVLRTGTGYGPKPCGATILDDMLAQGPQEMRSLEADLAMIQGRLPFDAGGNDKLAASNGQVDRTACGPDAAAAFVADNPINTDVYGVIACGGGSEVPGVICTHALIDDMQMQLKFEK